MRCNEIKTNLPLYFDDVLSVSERASIDEHLVTCPLCRQRLVDLQETRTGLRNAPRPQMPASRLAALRSAVAAELRPAAGTPSLTLIDNRTSWTQTWLMPLASGSLATLVIGFAMLSSILVSPTAPSEQEVAATYRSSVLLANTDPLSYGMDVSTDQFVDSRAAVSGESPSLNPQGALVALTKSFVRGEMHDDEVVVVADVFGNGLARIEEVVEPSRDRRVIEDLRKALQSDPAYAPFVPASMDKRSQTMRVVLKIQSVNVRTHLK